MHEVIARFNFKLNKYVVGALATFGILAVSIINAAPAAACRCEVLNETQVNRNTFSFTSEVSSLGGGRIDKVIYEFGDGTSAEAPTTEAPVTHSYAKSGEFEVKARIFATIDGQSRELDGEQCVKQIEVKPEPPVFECSSLDVQKLERTKYHFTATARTANGATLKNAGFDFGDNQSADGIAAHGNTVVIDHQYAKEGAYTVTATLHFMVSDAEETETCTVKVNVTPEACAFNPALTKESPECKKPEQPQAPQAPQNPQTPSTSTPQPQAELPKELPHTGPAEILGSTVGLSGIVAAGTHYIRSRRALRDIK